MVYYVLSGVNGYPSARSFEYKIRTPLTWKPGLRPYHRVVETKEGTVGSEGRKHNTHGGM